MNAVTGCDRIHTGIFGGAYNKVQQTKIVENDKIFRSN